MSKGIIDNMRRVVAGVENPGWPESQRVSDEQPTLADLVLPGSGHKFSDELAGLLTMLGGERDFA